MILLTLTHYDPAPDPNIKKFKNTFFILLTYLASEITEDDPFTDLSPHLLLQGLKAYFVSKCIIFIKWKLRFSNTAS